MRARTVSQTDRTSLANQYQRIRDLTTRLADPLSAEDCMIQSMPDASPVRWHLAHTAWFFETFVLDSLPGYEVFDEQFQYLFNSYYNRVGAQFPRSQRGLISRPGLQRTRQYREYVDQHMLEMLDNCGVRKDVEHAIQIGLNHEQQHQELILTDIKHALSCNPLLPAYHQSAAMAPSQRPIDRWLEFTGGIYEVGYAGTGFAYDNESPLHQVLIHDFSLAGHPVTCGQFIDFIEDGGYQRPDHWLAAGWDTVQEQVWTAPLYWMQHDGQWMQFTLAGLQPVQRDWPVCHVSYFEADAWARWAGTRLPSEFEWEVAAASSSRDQFADRLLRDGHAIHPTGGDSATTAPVQMFGGVWEWTSSSYAAYPGYAPPHGALGEYNGKFMCNQYVLRGGSVASSADHIRPTYRNFFPPDARWQFSGFRVAK
ncbi:MAG: ergothioneine biosynthesis protein EgtB [Pirellulaceae bacterium]